MSILSVLSVLYVLDHDNYLDRDGHLDHDDHFDHDGSVQVRPEKRNLQSHRDNLQLTCVQYSTSGKITSKFLTQRKQCENKRTAKENSVEILKWLLICSQDLRGFVRKVRLWPLIG